MAALGVSGHNRQASYRDEVAGVVTRCDQGCRYDERSDVNEADINEKGATQTRET